MPPQDSPTKPGGTCTRPAIKPTASPNTASRLVSSKSPAGSHSGLLRTLARAAGGTWMGRQLQFSDSWPLLAWWDFKGMGQARAVSRCTLEAQLRLAAASMKPWPECRFMTHAAKAAPSHTGVPFPRLVFKTYSWHLRGLSLRPCSTATCKARAHDSWEDAPLRSWDVDQGMHATAGVPAGRQWARPPCSLPPTRPPCSTLGMSVTLGASWGFSHSVRLMAPWLRGMTSTAKTVKPIAAACSVNQLHMGGGRPAPVHMAELAGGMHGALLLMTLAHGARLPR